VAKSNFLFGAFVLGAAGVVCRILGVVIRVPLTNIVGNYGIGIYQMVFPLYALLLVVSSAGFPVAVSKMVARERVSGNTKECKNILLNATILLGAIGLVVTILFMVCCVPIAKLQGNRDIWVIYLAIAPSIFLVCVMSALRGYFQGYQNMFPTAVSQIIEQIVKVGAAILMALAFIKISVVFAVFGAILAVTISEAVALVFLFVVYLFNKKSMNAGGGAGRAKISKKTMFKILKQAIPITAMSAIFPLILVFDSIIVVNLLTRSGTAYAEATNLFGISSGVVHALVNLPAVLGAAIATAVVPAVAHMYKREKFDELNEKMAVAVRATFIISIFFSVFFFVYSIEIIEFLYHRAFKGNAAHLLIASRLMRIESFLIITITLTSLFSAMLQGVDKARYPLIALFVGGTLKIVFQLMFLGTPMGIYAVSIGNVLCFTAAVVINTAAALKFVKIKKSITGIMARVAFLFLSFALTARIIAIMTPNTTMGFLISGAACTFAYVVLLYLFNFWKFKGWNLKENLNIKGE
jgi:stage V sporulation protein B